MQNSIKRRAIFDKHRFNADFLIVQETHSSHEMENIWQSEWGGKIIFAHGTTAARGVAIFIKKGLEIYIRNVYTDEDGRCVIFDLEASDIIVPIVALYAPNQDTPSFYRKRSEHKILIGDFNLTLNVELDRENTYCNNNNLMQEVQNIMDEFQLVDVWRQRYEEKREYSWIKSGTYPIKASRIDLALTSGGIDHYTQMIQYLSSIYTDHRALYMVLEVSNNQRGTGYWKLNTSILQDQQYINQMNIELERTINTLQCKSPSKKWEKIKSRIKEFTVKYARQQGSEDKLIISQLSEKINEYESSLPLTKEDDKILTETKAELEEKMMKRVRGIMFRSKVK